jgi:hypothetical protein
MALEKLDVDLNSLRDNKDHKNTKPPSFVIRAPFPHTGLFFMLCMLMLSQIGHDMLALTWKNIFVWHQDMV